MATHTMPGASLAQNPHKPSAVSPSAPARLPLGLLTALVVGSMIGSGIFALPQNMAAGAGAGAIVLGWLVTGVGMLALAFVYQALSTRQPSLDNGVYAYARASAGPYMGFNSAWGYWVSAWIGNVGYLVIVFGTLGNFFPVFGEGNSVAAIAGASILLWVMHALILRGVHGAAVLNAVVTYAKVIPLLVFVAAVVAAFKWQTFSLDFWGNPQMGSVLDQVKSTMLVTVWAFIGIEGANVYSARAANRGDVGRATLLGFVIALVLLMGVSLLSLGIVPQAELAATKNPSMAGVLEKVLGPWGAAFISIGLLVSVGGALLAWTLLAAETLFTPAGEQAMPQCLARQNAAGVPANALWVTNALVQLFLLLTLWAKASYLALITLATSMILVPYLFSAAYGLLAASRAIGYQGEPAARTRDIAIAGVATLYCAWLLYAAGPKYLLLSSLLYLPGALLFLLAKREQRAAPLMQRWEWVILGAVALLAATAAYLLATGQLAL